jgi:hypothetical protein
MTATTVEQPSGGLTVAEVERRQAEYGPTEPPPSMWVVAREQGPHRGCPD